MTTEAFLRHVPARHRASPQYLLYLHGSGHSAEAAAFEAEMDQFLAQGLASHASGQIDSAQLKAQVLHRWGDLGAWWQASHEIMAPILEKYLRWILNSPLSSGQKFELLHAGGTGNTEMGGAITVGHHELLGTFIGAICKASSADLAPEDRQALLHVRHVDGVPLLHHLASVGLEQLPAGAVHALSEFVSAIVRAQLPVDVTAELCGAAYEHGQGAPSAVQRAMGSGHVPVASAIAFAIQANEPDDERKNALLATLKVNRPQLMVAIRQWAAQRNAAPDEAR